MLGNVRTRWNSTCIMLIRALRVRNTLDQWLLLEDDAELYVFQLDEEEWTHVRYLATLLRPFLY